MAAAGLSLPAVGPYRPGSDFPRWLNSVELYMAALDVTGDERKTAILLHLLGPEVQEVYGTLPEPIGITGCYAVCVAKLRGYLAPQRNVIADRLAFQRLQMVEGEQFDAFLSRLRLAAAQCRFPPEQVSAALRDQAIAGCTPRLQERVLQRAVEAQEPLSLQDVVNIIHNVERTDRLLREVRQGAQPAVPQEEERVQALRQGHRRESADPGRAEQRCFQCGELGHWRDHCPGAQPRQASAPRCYRCGEGGHLQRDCSKQRKGVKLVQDSDQADWQVSAVQPAAAEWAQVKVNGQEMTMLIDTGSPVTIVCAETHIPGLKLRPSELHLTSFTGQQIRLRGEGEVDVEVSGRVARLRLVVSNMGPHRPLMGREWIKALRAAPGLESLNVCPVAPLPTLKEVLDRHREVFEDELGKIPVKVALRLKQGAKPVYRRARPVPFALQQDIERELDKWLEQGIAEKVPPGHFSGWGTPLVPIPKKDGVRLCADYRITVNPQLQPLKYPMRTPEELFASIRGKMFCKLDCRNAYLQCELDEESREMTTVTTHRGAMRMNRLPYGISTCGAQFQAIMDQVLDGLSGVVCYLDDVLIGADNDRELMDRLDRVLERLKDNGVRLKKEKCQFGVREVMYLGWRLSEAGLRPVQEKTAAVTAAPDPRNVQELRSLIGSVSYYQRLLPNLSTVLAPLYALLKKGVKWAWTAECAAAVRCVKDMLSTAPVLMRYDPALPLRLVTDASATGVGAALMQVTPDGLERPVQYASRTLTPTERKYAEVEKEAAAVSFGVRRFHQFLFGRTFTLVVDNRTLSRILNPDRELPSLAAARMQRYALQLAAYQYKIELRRTEEMRLADTMSRLPVPDAAENRRSAEEEATYGGGGVMFVAEQGPCLTAQQIAAATRRDPVLARALAAVRSGWPAMVDPDLADGSIQESPRGADD